MKLYRFDISAANFIIQYGSERAAVTHILQGNSDMSINCIILGAGGKLGAHEAANNQLFMVVSGRGWVKTGDEDYQRILPNQAAFWEQGEMHETMTHNGLTAIVIEGDSVNPDALPEVVADNGGMWEM